MFWFSPSGAMKVQTVSDAHSMKKELIALAAILLLGLALRVGFASLVIASHDTVSFADIHGDTGGYIQLGERMYDRKSYTASTQNHRNRGLVRPPGYPAFYTAVRALYHVPGIDLRADLRQIVWPQVFLSLAQVVATFYLVLRAVRSLTFAIVGGLMAALSPTAIGCAAMAMPDGLFAAAFSLAFLGLLVAMRPAREGSHPSDRSEPERPAEPVDSARRLRRKTANRTSLAGLSLAIAALLKPAAIYWPIVGVPVLLVARGINRASLGDARRLFLPMIIAVAGWTAYNGIAEEVWVFSTVSERNVRYGVVPAVEMAVKLNRIPTEAEYGQHAQKSTRRDNAFIREGGLPYKLHRQITSESSAVIRAHPLWTARVLAANLRNQLSARYKMIHRQLANTHLPMASHLRALVDATDTRPAVLVWYGLMLLSVPLWWFTRRRCDGSVLLVCWIGFAYVVLPTGTVGNEGSRLILAAEPMAITLIVASLAMGAHLVREFVRRRIRRVDSHTEPARGQPAQPHGG